MIDSGAFALTPSFSRERGRVGVRVLTSSVRRILFALCAATLPTAYAQAPAVAPYAVTGAAIVAPLGGLTGDALRGRAIVVDRQGGMCLLCHPGPFPEERFQGNLAPDLASIGRRLAAGQLRLRIVDSRRVNPETTMPAYHRIAGRMRVAPAWSGRPLLTGQQVEDVVALLATLRD